MQEYLLLGERWLLAAVFAAAFFGKAHSAARFGHFVTTVIRLTNAPERPARRIAGVVVAFEGAIALQLLVDPTAWWGLLQAVGLLVLFITVVVHAIRGGILTPCRCFGGSGAVMSYPLLVRNVLLIAVAVPGILHGPQVPSTSMPGSLLAAGVGVVLAAALLRYYDAVSELIVDRWMTPEPVDAEAERP
jgi:hypothetical protein